MDFDFPHHSDGDGLFRRLDAARGAPRADVLSGRVFPAGHHRDRGCRARLAGDDLQSGIRPGRLAQPPRFRPRRSSDQCLHLALCRRIGRPVALVGVSGRGVFCRASPGRCRADRRGVDGRRQFLSVDAPRPAPRDPADHHPDDDHDRHLVLPGVRFCLCPDAGRPGLFQRSAFDALLPLRVLQLHDGPCGCGRPGDQLLRPDRNRLLRAASAGRGRLINQIGKGTAAFSYALLAIGATVALFPLALMVVSALKTSAEIVANPLALPRAVQWINFSRAWTDAQLGRSLMNSAEVTGLTVLLICSTSSMAAYALVRQSTKALKWISAYFLATTTLPIQLFLFPLYFGYARLGLIDNVFALSLVYAAIFSPFSIFLLRTYFLAIPREIEEAAIMDGANKWQVFYQVCLPLVSPGILTVAV